MNELKIFENPEFGKIRTVAIDGEPWLVGKDVALVLGYGDTDQAIRKHVDNWDKKILTRQNDGLDIRSENATLSIPNRGLTIINESGLYSLVLSSKLPKAKQFRRWVTSEVLPSIRKTGGYTAPKAEVRVIPKREPEVSLSGLARLASVARKAILDTGGSRFEAGAEVLLILDHYGLPVPGWAKEESKNRLFLMDFKDFF